MAKLTPRNAFYAGARNLHRYRKLGVAAPSVLVASGVAALLDGGPWYLWPVALVAAAGAVAWGEKKEKDRASWAGVAFGLTLVANLVLGWVDHSEWAGLIALISFLATPAYAALWFVRDVVPRGTSNAYVEKKAENDERQGGMAGRLDIAQWVGPGAARLLARQVRPSFLAYTDKELRKVPIAEYATLVIKVGLGLFLGEKVYEPLENNIGRIGAPRTGKTQAMAESLAEAPGSLVVTSTKADIAMAVHPFRTERPWWLVNPFGLGKFPSNFETSIVEGCDDFDTAKRRAKSLLPYSPDTKVEHWRELGRPVLGLMMHAAGLDARYTMEDVARWASNTKSERSLEEITTSLMKVTKGGSMMAAQIRAHWLTNEDTRTSIDTAIRPALYWVADDRARGIGDAPRGRKGFDFERFLTNSETLYLLGPESELETVSPLFAFIATELAHVGLKIAAESTNGRVEPPCKFGLDEAPNVCPVPLPEWTSYFGSQGMPIEWACQSPAQLRSRWGEEGASVIVSNTSSLMYSGGSNSARDLQDLSVLLGETRRRIPEAPEDARDAFWRTAVLTPGQIRSLETGMVLLLRRGMLPMVGETPWIKDRKGWVPMPLVETVEEKEAEVTLPRQGSEARVLDRQ
jgi:type IV secretion system protein VirD4